MDNPIIDKYRPVKTYTIDLDVDPKDRWTEISIEYTKKIKKLLRYCDQILGSVTYPASWLAWLFSNSVFYIDELRGISRDTGIDLSQLILMQLCYEVCACCTSVIVDKDDKTYHYRTMDWAMDELKNMTIEVTFTRSGIELYSATCWAGYVGVLTGIRKGLASVSLNYRRTKDGSLMSNLNAMIGGSWPAGFLIRHSLEESKSFKDFTSYLSNSAIISPCYIIINGSRPGSGRILVRDRDGLKQRIRMGDGSNHIAQTNIDHDRFNDRAAPNILMSRERLTTVDERIRERLQDVNEIESLIEIFDSYPIINHETIYVTLMDCATGEIQTRVVEYE
jgi:beta subunit of N-acylethanolamine-hydrolyzing acid amidase/Acyl-coenzyme A:6-aminopenicillanic acid acyl-transferase